MGAVDEEVATTSGQMVRYSEKVIVESARTITAAVMMAVFIV